MPSNTTLYTTVAQSNVGSNNLTTLYNINTSNINLVPNTTPQSNVGGNNFITLYNASASQINPTNPYGLYGNANVQRFLNQGTDGANTIQNIVIPNVLSLGSNLALQQGLSNTPTIVAVNNSNSNSQKNILISAGSITNIANLSGNTLIAGGAFVAGGQMGTPANALSSNTQDLRSGTIQFFGGTVYTNENPGRNIQGGSFQFIGGGAINNGNVNLLTSGSIILSGGTTSFKRANTVQGGATIISTGNVNANNQSNYSAGNVLLNSVQLTQGRLQLGNSSGNIGNVTVGDISFGSNLAVTVFNGSNNITVSNINTPANMTISTGGISSNNSATSFPPPSNINNVSFGNATTQSIVIETGRFTYPVGSNIANVRANNFRSGNINLRTGWATNAASVTNNNVRGNITLEANVVTISTSNNGINNFSNTTFYSNGTVLFGNAPVSSNGTSLVVQNLNVLSSNTIGIGNIASIFLNGNGNTVLAGNGVWIAGFAPLDVPIYGRTQTINIITLPSSNVIVYGRTQALFVSTANNQIDITGRTGNITVYL